MNDFSTNKIQTHTHSQIQLYCLLTTKNRENNIAINSRLFNSYGWSDQLNFQKFHSFHLIFFLSLFSKKYWKIAHFHENWRFIEENSMYVTCVTYITLKSADSVHGMTTFTIKSMFTSQVSFSNVINLPAASIQLQYNV